MSFGLTIEKLFLIGLVALLIVGPDRLPAYSAQLARLVKRLRGMAKGAETRLREEMGDDFDAVEWKNFDPRQYDPRRIIRDALKDEEPAKPTATVHESAYAQRKRAAESGESTPFDVEST